MTTSMTRRSALVAVGTLPALLSAQEAEFPSKAVRLVVPVGPGTATDLLARQLAERLTANWKQGVVVENVAGAGGIVGTQTVLRAQPDGHTLLFVASTHVVNYALNKNLPYHPIRDFVPIACLGAAPVVIAANPKAFTSLQDFISKAKAAPGTINYASVGVGSSMHLAMEMLQRLAGIKMEHIPFNTPGQVTTALISGEVPVAATAVATSVPHIRSGQLRALGVGTTKPTRLLDNVAPVSDTYPGFEITPWIGVMGPKGLPSRIAQQIESEILKIVAAPAFESKMIELGIEPYVLNARDFAAMKEKELARWTQVVEQAGIQPKQ